MVIGSDCHILCFQQCPLFLPTWNQTTRMIDYSVTRVIPVKFRLAQYLSHQAGIFIPADQFCDLTVGCYPAKGNLRYNREYLIDQPVIQNFIHDDSFMRTDCTTGISSGHHTSVHTGSQ